jgi:hypothetical protein
MLDPFAFELSSKPSASSLFAVITTGMDEPGDRMSQWATSSENDFAIGYQVFVQRTRLSRRSIIGLVSEYRFDIYRYG